MQTYAFLTLSYFTAIAGTSRAGENRDEDMVEQNGFLQQPLQIFQSVAIQLQGRKRSWRSAAVKETAMV